MTGGQMEFLTNSSFTCGLISTFALLIWKRLQLERIISHMAEHVTIIDARSLIRFLAFLVALLTIQVTLFVNSYIGKIESDRQEALLTIAAAFLEYWIMITCIFYWTVLQVLYLYVKRHLDVVRLHASTEQLELTLVCKAVSSITQSVGEFDQLMSPLPFLWFMFGIVSAAGAVTSIIQEPSNLIKLLLLMQDYLPPVLVIVSLTRFFGKVTAMAASIGRQVTSNKSLEAGHSILCAA